MVFRSVAALCGAAGVALAALSGPAAADELTYTFNIDGTSDYVFRGISQSAREPTLQGGADFAYGMFYQGIWGSGLDFGPIDPKVDPNIAEAEIDIYGGIAPVWKGSPLGDVTFNFGYIYYWYPGARDDNAELDYVEGKAGYSITSSIIKNLTTGTTVYYSPRYTGDSGKVWTVESTAAYALPTMGPIATTISGTWGWVKGEDSNLNFVNIIVNGDDNYDYWNAGVTFAADKISLDLRYWDTNIKDDNATLGTAKFCSGKVLQCDETFLATIKVVVP